MCRRFKQSRSFEQWVQAMRLSPERVDQPLNQWHTGVCTPERHTTIVFNLDGKAAPRLVMWGLKPYSNSDIVCYHARSEKAFSEPWSNLMADRVLVPVNAWREGDGVFGSRDIINFAGLTSGHNLVIMTRGSTDKVRPFHGRMPLGLNRNESIKWLSRHTEVDTLKTLLEADHDASISVKIKPAA